MEIKGTTTDEKKVTKKPSMNTSMAKPTDAGGQGGLSVLKPPVLKPAVNPVVKPATSYADPNTTLNPTRPATTQVPGGSSYTPTAKVVNPGSSYVPSTTATRTPTGPTPVRPGGTPATTTPVPTGPPPGTAVGPVGGQADMSASVTQAGSVMEQFGQLKQEMTGASNEHLAAIGAQFTQMTTMLDQLEAQILGSIKGQMNGDDPGMQAAIGLIKEEAARMRDEALEELNTRGLVQSGVYAEMLSRLNKGELTSVQQTVSQRFGDLQNQLNSAMMSLAQTRIGALGQSQQNMNNVLTNKNNMMAQIGMQGAQLGLQEKGQNMQNSQFYAGLGQQKDIAQMNDTTQRYGIDTSASMSKYGTDMQYKSSQNALGQSASQFQQQMARQNQLSPSDILAQQKFQLEKDQFGYTQTMNDQQRMDMQKAQASQDYSALTQQVGSGKLSLVEAIRQINNSPYDSAIKQNFITSLKGQFASTYTPPVQTGSGYSPYSNAGQGTGMWNRPK